jgi:hypothetical protein
MMFLNSSDSVFNWAGYYLKGIYGDFAWKDSEEEHLLHLFDPNDEVHRSIKHNYWWNTKSGKYLAYPITSIMIGYIQGFGWSAFKNCVHRFAFPSDPVNKLSFCMADGIVPGVGQSVEKENQALVDKWLIFMSEEAKKDITPYMAHFYLTPSPECRIYLDKMKYKKWDLVYIPERIVVTPVGKSVKLTSPAKYALTMCKNLKFSWSGKPGHGVIVDDFTYKPFKGFKGDDKIAFTLTDMYGNIQQSEINVKVVDPGNFPEFTGAVLGAVSTAKWSKIKFSTKFKDPVILASVIEVNEKQSDASFIPEIRNLSPKGCEIRIRRKTGDKKVTKVLPVALCIMDSGTLTLKYNGIRADIGIVNLVPETISSDMHYHKKVLERNLSALRDSTFGQVVSSNNTAWSEFFTGSLPDIRAKIIGAYGDAAKFTKKEKVGYAFLKTGVYQFGDKNVRITQNSISVNSSILRMKIPTIKELERKLLQK